MKTWNVGALPIINQILQRMRLNEFLKNDVPPEDRRTKLPAADCLMVLLKNILLSREPIYGIGEWASGFAPDLLGITPEQLLALNDDRAGRALTRLFRCPCIRKAARAVVPPPAA